MQAQQKQKLGNVKVVCRFRPLNDREKQLGNAIVHELLDDKTVAISAAKDGKMEKSSTSNVGSSLAGSNNNNQPLKFSFDKVFDCATEQIQVYRYAAASVIESVIEGFNGTIFAYGQTSSGKTHTMEGEIGQGITQQSGIIPRMVVQVFESISKCSGNIQFRIKVSMVQLYMEKLRDLIDTSKTDLKIRSDKKRGIFIQNLTETYISSAQQVYELMEIARSTRAIAATNMNQRSSRSHLLFILTISQNNLDDMSAKTGKLYLVDLAGSEKVGKTGAEGKLLDQAKKINISLTALGKVINALTDGRSTHVPYRDSKLTRVLQQSLGGNSKTTLIVTCSPHPNNVAQTISSLRFGVSAKKIKNKPKINKQLTVPQLQNLLEKVQKTLADRQKYIDQLKNHIVTDLKQKSAPAFCLSSDPNQKMNSNEQLQQQEQETDLVGELQRQLQIQRNLNLVQQEQLTNLKEKFQKLGNQKENIQTQLATLRKSVKQLEQERQSRQKDKQRQQKVRLSEPTPQLPQQFDSILRQLHTLTSDPRILSLFSSLSTHSSSQSQPHCTPQQLTQLHTLRTQNQSLQSQSQKSQKIMQKKLSQLENNICQLTHAYYDLLIIQQRHKVDNIFLRKKVEEKDGVILGLRGKIRDLEEMNRELEEGKWDGDEQEGRDREGKEGREGRKALAKYVISQEQENKFNQLCEKRNLGNNANLANTKVVKVVRGGNK